jgi:acyl carrier protein
MNRSLAKEEIDFINDTIAEVLNIKTLSWIVPDASLFDKGETALFGDSIDFVTLIMEIEDKFNISIPDVVADKDINTVDDLYIAVANELSKTEKV